MGVIGAISLKNGKSIFSRKKGYFKSDDICEFLKKITENFNKEKIVIYWDNATVHKSMPVQEKLAELNLEVVYGPPHSPEFNGIELVWAKMK